MLIDPHTRSAALLARLEQDTRNEFQTLVAAILSATDLDRVEELIINGQIVEALDVVIPSVTVFADRMSTKFVDAGVDTATSISRLSGLPVGFNQTDANAVNFMQNNRGRIIANFTQEQAQAARRLVGESVLRGQSARQQAQALRDSIGLTSRQALTVEKFRTNLDNLSRDALTLTLRDRRFDRTVQNAINSDTPLTVAQIDNMVDNFRERLIAFRSRVVGQSEALRVVNAGNLEAFRQAVDLGLIDGTSIERRWKTAGDSKVRNTHTAMNGQIRGLSEDFVSGAGARLRFPGDPNAGLSETVGCRCVIETSFNVG